MAQQLSLPGPAMHACGPDARCPSRARAHGLLGACLAGLAGGLGMIGLHGTRPGLACTVGPQMNVRHRHIPPATRPGSCGCTPCPDHCRQTSEGSSPGWHAGGACGSQVAAWRAQAARRPGHKRTQTKPPPRAPGRAHARP